ncbi:MAG: hypothetical protein BWX95_02707 [Bacteroidetes bacterium ADurb.Bin141]|nr:MAG: hypothetical protein BWX95_02707 [Bacteroidetes bacterium ADurb.Bin141]
MKQRLLTGWNVQRVLYVLIGGAIVIQSVVNREWIGVLPGGYFAAMGLFAFGCASGNCYGGSCTSDAGSSLTKENTERTK